MSAYPTHHVLVATIPMSPGDELRVTRAGSVTHLRRWFSRDGQWLPSRDGIEIEARVYAAVVHAMQANCREIVSKVSL